MLRREQPDGTLGIPELLTKSESAVDDAQGTRTLIEFLEEAGNGDQVAVLGAGEAEVLVGVVGRLAEVKQPERAL